MLKDILSRFQKTHEVEHKKEWLYAYLGTLSFVIIALFLALAFDRDVVLEIRDFGFIRSFAIGGNSIQVDLEPEDPLVGQGTSLVISFGRQVSQVELFLTHESLLDFQYLPLSETGGVYTSSFIPQKEGRYLGWVGYVDNGQQTFSFSFDTFQSYSAVPKILDRTGVFGGYKAELSYQKNLKAEQTANFVLKISANGKAVVPSEHIGGWGQVVLVREDGEFFDRVVLSKRGNDLAFSYRFASAGFYKLWIQYKAEGSAQVITAPFVVAVD